MNALKSEKISLFFGGKISTFFVIFGLSSGTFFNAACQTPEPQLSTAEQQQPTNKQSNTAAPVSQVIDEFLEKGAPAQDIAPDDIEPINVPAVRRTAQSPFKDLLITDIVVEGNKYVKSEAILNRLPYKIGQEFDPERSSFGIKNLYDMGNFRQIRLDGEKIDDKKMRLFVVVEEKKLLEKVEFKGNKSLKTKKIKEKINIDKLTTVDEETLRRIALSIQKLYHEENRHLAKITFSLIPNKQNPDKTTAVFTIVEGPTSNIKFVKFVGNDNIPARKLRGIIYSRENWLLSFMDSAGTYSEEMLEMDKHRIEYFYRDHGYLMAKVTQAKVDFENKKKDISITFHVKEGKQYLVRELRVMGDEIYSEDELMPLVTLKEDEPFSQTKLVQSMNRIKDLYGEKGYIYCDVYPQVKPDEKKTEVDITFHVERGNKLYANRITITGNKVTHDKVIRRQLEIAEGDLITSKKLTRSQSSVEYLSYFEREGVKWKMHRISDELVDLEMNVKEAKTGNFNVSLSYGTDQYNPRPSMRGMLSLDKANLFGRGIDVGGQLQADRHRIRRLEARFFDPHIFDSDISTGINFYKRWDEFEQWTTLDRTPIQKVLGGDLRLGLWLPKIDKRLQMIFDLGIEDIRTNNPRPRHHNIYFEPVVKRTFQEGTMNWFGLEFVKDTRDHQVYPTQGYKIIVGARTALPQINNRFSYIKQMGEVSFYRTLIEKFYLEEPLVLGMRARLGNIRTLSNLKPVPYKELFHMGGQTTVRGFVWGSIGPAWITGDPLGAQNELLFNVEIIFPLVPDYSMKGHVFYDAGAGWNTPKNDIPDTSLLQRDNFDLRHSVGFGLNLEKPVPAKIDWGFKLDRRKKDHESPSEFHLSMNYAW